VPERACKAGALPAELHAHSRLLQSFSITYAATATACAPEILEHFGAGTANPVPTLSASSSRKGKFSLIDLAYSDVMSFPRECPAHTLVRCPCARTASRCVMRNRRKL
jgi:hypothetical protein